jgi:hypothetical protein
MDVIGQSPTNQKGEYFRNNVWWWRPLAAYCMEIAPEITARCEYWQSNDGDGLNGRDSLALADALQEEIDSGRCEAYAKIRDAELSALPNEACKTCDGTGTRKPVPECGAGDIATGIKCNGCNGSGSVRPYACEYPFAVENVQAFITFLRGCGGFAIH